MQIDDAISAADAADILGVFGDRVSPQAPLPRLRCPAEARLTPQSPGPRGSPVRPAACRSSGLSESLPSCRQSETLAATNQGQREAKASPLLPGDFGPCVVDSPLLAPVKVADGDRDFPGLRVGPHAELDLDPVGVEEPVRWSVKRVIRSDDHFFTARAKNPATEPQTKASAEPLTVDEFLPRRPASERWLTRQTCISTVRGSCRQRLLAFPFNERAFERNRGVWRAFRSIIQHVRAERGGFRIFSAVRFSPAATHRSRPRGGSQAGHRGMQ